MTKEDWDVFEKKLSDPYGGMVRLLVDGYEITVIVVQDKPLHFNLVLYVDGKFKTEWVANDCDIRRRFFRKCSKKVYSAAEIREFRKELGKRRADKIAAERFEYYTPCWNTAKSLKAHLIKNNQSIEFLRSEDKNAEETHIDWADIPAVTEGAE